MDRGGQPTAEQKDVKNLTNGLFLVELDFPVGIHVVVPRRGCGLPVAYPSVTVTCVLVFKMLLLLFSSDLRSYGFSFAGIWRRDIKGKS